MKVVLVPSYAITWAASGTILVSGTINDNGVVNNQLLTIEQDPGGSPAELDGTGKGPVITTEGYALLTVNQLTLTGGSAPFGGGVFLGGGDAAIDDSIISGNTATTSGGGIGDDSYFNLIDSTVSGNTALSGVAGGWGRGHRHHRHWLRLHHRLHGLRQHRRAASRAPRASRSPWWGPARSPPESRPGPRMVTAAHR